MRCRRGPNNARTRNARTTLHHHSVTTLCVCIVFAIIQSIKVYSLSPYATYLKGRVSGRQAEALCALRTDRTQDGGLRRTRTRSIRGLRFHLIRFRELVVRAI